MLTYSLRVPLLALLLLAVAPRFAHAQTSSVGIGTTAPDASAALDIVSSSKGLLLPRVASAAAIARPAAGLLVYQTGSPAGFYYNSGPAAATWLRLSPADNLGNHTATQNLDLGTNQLVGNGGTAGLALSSTGDVGIGTTSPAAKLDVAGDVRIPATNSYTYASPRTQALMLGAFDFRAEDGASPLVFSQGIDEVYPGPTSGALRATIHLPQGAFITSMTLLYYDNEGAFDLKAQLLEYRTVGLPSYYNAVAAASSSGTPGYSQVDAGQLFYPIDNTTRAYSVRVSFGLGNSTNLRLRGVRVNYAVSQAD